MKVQIISHCVGTKLNNNNKCVDKLYDILPQFNKYRYENRIPYRVSTVTGFMGCFSNMKLMKRLLQNFDHQTNFFEA